MLKRKCHKKDEKSIVRNCYLLFFVEIVVFLFNTMTSSDDFVITHCYSRFFGLLAYPLSKVLDCFHIVLKTKSNLFSIHKVSLFLFWSCMTQQLVSLIVCFNMHKCHFFSLALFILNINFERSCHAKYQTMGPLMYVLVILCVCMHAFENSQVIQACQEKSSSH
jgi:hypothetical protein